MNKNLMIRKILFKWERLTFQKLQKLCRDLSIKEIRWLAMIHPDNKTRENLYRISKINIGEKTVINFGLNVYSNEKNPIEIGRNCAIAANVSMIYESGPNMSLLNEIEIVKEKYINKGKIVIEDNVWIGANVIIFPGVRIGESSIIGAGSIITKDIPSGSIVRGNSSKIIDNVFSDN